jgi:hypothetical protein
MNLEDLKTYITQYATRARTILGRKVDPVGTEYDILEDVVTEVRKIRLATRDIEIPGITRSWNENLIQAAVSYFKEKVKKDIMPLQYAKDDNLIIEPLYRPKIFNMRDFTVTWSGLTPPATIDLLTPDGRGGPYNLQVDKELIILTDIIALSPNPAVTELLVTVDGDPQRPVVARKDFLVSDLRIFEFPFPVVADINLRIQGRVETASGSFTYLPIGIHVVLGSVHAKELA